MKNQPVDEGKGAARRLRDASSGPDGAFRSVAPGNAVTPFPRPGQPSAPLAARCAHAAEAAGRPVPMLLSSESVTALRVDLPEAPTRQRRALLTFAVEDRLAAPIDALVVRPGPLRGAARGEALALVAGREVLAALEAGLPPATPILPDFLAIPRPEPNETGHSAWSVWRDGARCVVRVSDGTGFAVATEMLPFLWRRAGQPRLFGLGAALPAGLPATDLSLQPPPPDPLDLAFSFSTRARGEAAQRLRRKLVAAGLILGAGLALQLGLVAADVHALDRIAQAERQAAVAALAPVLPGIAVTADPAPILARLAPAADVPERGDLLPMLSDISQAILKAGETASFRRLSWGAAEGTMSLQVQASGLEDLQAVQRALQATGFDVTSGAANAGDGVAEVEMRVSRGAAR